MRYAFLAILLFFVGCGGSQGIESKSSNLLDENKTTIIDSNQTDSNTTIPNNDVNETVDNNETTNSTDSNTSQYFGGLYYQQWYMDKNDTFYQLNNIDGDAHIHPSSSTYKTYTGKGIKIAVIDDGFDVNHPEIKYKIIAQIALNSDNTLSQNVQHSVSTDHHGTAVTGIIASSDDNAGIRGIAPNVELILIKMPSVLSDSIIIKLFDEAVNSGADIINCSWGTGDVSDAVIEHINNLAINGRDGKGIITVFASGNDNDTIQNDESSIDGVIAVGATDSDNLRTTYSNYGKELDIVAPGGYNDGIATLDPLGLDGVSSDGFNRFDEYYLGEPSSFIGTSAAAPIVTGTIALLLEKDPSLTFTQIRELLKSSTDTIGQNTPYLDDMISSNSQIPTVTGLLGTTGFSDFRIKLQNKENTNLYFYTNITLINGDRTFSSIFTQTVPEGTYEVQLTDTNDSIIWATDESFEININSQNKTDTTIRKSDFYGYGKINLTKLLQ